ncbi:MAG: hypothetical protein KJ906_02625 [Nanoarchaeota archaeon]|nr:hypothetical protein [Nanoarchaeota archaeon]
MKGVIKVEFILGVVIFAIIIFYVASQINTAFIGINVDTNLDMLKSESISVLTILANDKVVGLSYNKNTLSLTKINEWNEAKTNNECNQLKSFNLGGHRLNVYKEDEPKAVLFCGYVGLSTLRTNVVRHVKFDDGKIGNMTMEMW